MIVDCISDLHGHYPELEGGDVLIVAGDLTASDKLEQYFSFFDWIESQNYRKKIVTAGNHDNLMQKEGYMGPEGEMKGSFDYLCDSGTDYQGVKIWGSPWTKTFPGINPHCMAFTCDTEEQLAEKFSTIPEELDILITHSPPLGILDKNRKDESCGSRSLREKIASIPLRNRPKLWVWGHIHESYGEFYYEAGDRGSCQMVNASHMTGDYEPINKPIRVVL